MIKGLLMAFFAFGLCTLLSGCSRPNSTAHTAFYYWKSNFYLNAAQDSLLRATGNRLYLHLFDVAWDDRSGKTFPDAVVRLRASVKGLQIVPVIYIRNQVFEHLTASGTDSLARQVTSFTERLAQAQQLAYDRLQFDCDWTLKTRDRYFQFLLAIKKIAKLPLEATIRLHQVKYRAQTGVPPVNSGVLMFYNMGKISADADSPNSIYNEADAEKYLAELNNYPLPLDVALPAFSWSVHSRNGKVRGLPMQISRQVLADSRHFTSDGAGYRAKNSFLLSGLYILKNDIFKPETISPGLLDQAARQLAPHLKLRPGRNIIYYELANIDTNLWQAAEFQRATARF